MDWSMINPYTSGGYVRTTDFYGRQALIDELLTSNNARTYLVGNRRIGKTSLLYYLKDHSLDVALFVSLQGAGPDGPKMASDFQRSLSLQFKHYPQHEEALSLVSEANPHEMSEVIELLGLAAEEKQFNVLLLLDEAERLLLLDPKDLDRLHRAFEEQNRIRVVLAATRKLAALYTSDGDNSPFLDGFKTVYLSIMSAEEAQSLICQTKNIKIHIDVSEKLILEICDVTGKHPYLIQSLCERLFQPDKQSFRPIQDKDLNLEWSFQSYCKQEYDVLSPSERAILRNIAKNHQAERTQLAQLPELSNINLDQYMPTLELLGLLQIEDGKLRVGNKILEKWLISQPSDTISVDVSDQASKAVAKQANLSDKARRFSNRKGQRIPASCLDSFMVRLFDQMKNPVGVGFLISEIHIITCAHVVSTALGLNPFPPNSPEPAITLDFPLLASRKYLQAQVVVWLPLDDNGCGDIAVLEIKNQMPGQTVPVHLIYPEDVWGHPFRAFGFPAGYDHGVWASGWMKAHVSNGLLQIEDTKQTGYFIQPGFSGGPVWDEKENGVVGMIVAADRSPIAKTAYVIPCSLFADHLPK
jgi:predicted transcriptional regulator